MAKFDPFLSLDCATVEGVGAQSTERKGSNFAAQRSGAIVQKPNGPHTYNLNIWLWPSGNHVPHQVAPRPDDPRVAALVEGDGPVEGVGGCCCADLLVGLGLDLDAPLDSDLWRGPQ